MNRPSRKLAHLLEKVARKESISRKKPGKRTKAWRKFAAVHAATIEVLKGGTPSEAQA